MPPKQRITREMILERSFIMFSQEGMESVNARSVAKALNCSTQPIFSYFSGMEDLKNALEQKAKETFDAMLADLAEDGDPIVRVCEAYVRFAAREPRLFTHLFLRPVEVATHPLSGEEIKSELVKKECAFSGMSEELSVRVYTEMSIYAHGFAALFASGHADAEMDIVRKMLDDAYRAIVMHIKADA